MAADKPIKPLPFPGESPTVSLAMAAGQQYGFHEGEKPARAGTKARAAAKAKKKPARKAMAAKKPTRRATARSR